MLYSGPVLWEKGGWLCLLCLDISRENETYDGTFEFPTLSHIYGESIRVLGRCRDRDMRLSAVWREDKGGSKWTCLPSAETHQTLGWWLSQAEPKRWLGGAVWLHRLRGELEVPRLHILVWFISFSSLYYWNSKLHFMLVIRWMLLLFPQEKLISVCGCASTVVPVFFECVHVCL